MNEVLCLLNREVPCIYVCSRFTLTCPSFSLLRGDDVCVVCFGLGKPSPAGSVS